MSFEHYPHVLWTAFSLGVDKGDESVCREIQHVRCFSYEHLGTKYFKLEVAPQSRSAYTYRLIEATGFPEMKQISNMKLQVVVLGIAALTSFGFSANASEVGDAFKATMVPMLGTLSVEFAPMMSEGKLQGCTLVFSALVVDDKYKVGEYLKLNGNIGILNFKGNLGANLKLVVNRVDFDTSPVSFLPSPPSRAYLIKSDFSTTQDGEQKSFPTETLGGLFSTFDAVIGLDFISHAIIERKVGIGFNQKNGKLDIVSSLELDVTETDIQGNRKRSEDSSNRFSECLQSVADSIK
jgi:hypothetical protein